MGGIGIGTVHHKLLPLTSEALIPLLTYLGCLTFRSWSYYRVTLGLARPLGRTIRWVVPLGSGSVPGVTPSSDDKPKSLYTKEIVNYVSMPHQPTPPLHLPYLDSLNAHDHPSTCHSTKNNGARLESNNRLKSSLLKCLPLTNGVKIQDPENTLLGPLRV